MLTVDSETCGLYSVPVLIQYAVDDGPVTLYSIWDETANKTLELIEWMMDQEVCGFNLAFDMFQFCKIYTMMRLLSKEDREYPAGLPSIIKELVKVEREARFGPCLKPKAACDLMLIARKGKYQSTMDRSDVRIRKVPWVLAYELAEELEKRIPLDDIYFANRKKQNLPKWKVFDNEEDKAFKDVVLKFRASTSLKNLVKHALGKEVIKYSEAANDLPKGAYPEELGYAPFADANKNKPWQDVLKMHVSHWSHNKIARQYAEDDVINTRALWKHLGSPEPGDTDSELACMVAACRWKGYAIDVESIEVLKDKAKKKYEGKPMAPKQAMVALSQVMDELELAILKNSTKRIILEGIAYSDEWDEHPAQEVAKEILEARQAKNEYDLLTKLLRAGRFHASFVVIGTLSSRMAGADKLNPQGIKRSKYIRECFPLSDPGYVLCGGDFVSFEVVLADAVYHDDRLRKDLQNGRSIHAVFGTCVYPNMTYEQIIADKEKYTRSKSAVFAMIYGGQAYTLKTRLGVPEEIAEEAYQKFMKLYPGVALARQTITDRFCSMRQPGGIGTKVEWHEPDNRIASLLGFERDFTLENNICKALFKLAHSIPKDWHKKNVKVNRKEDRTQTAAGATQTAIYAAAFALQSANMRAAGNHVIQSSGAQITKEVQRKIWDLQPHGISQWLVQPMNIHDEIMCPTKPCMAEKVEKVVYDTVNSFKDKVPLLDIEWNRDLKSWADK